MKSKITLLHSCIKTACFFFFFFVVATTVIAREKKGLEVFKSPFWINPVTLNYNEKASTQNITEGYQFLLYDVQVNTVLREKYYHFVRKIISDEGVQNGSDLTITYDPSFEKVFFHSLKIIRNGEIIDRTASVNFRIIQPERRLNSYIYDGEYNALAFLDDIRKGDLIEYAYSYKGVNPVYEDKFDTFLYFQFNSPVSKVYYRIIVSAENELQIKNNKTDIKYTLSKTGNTFDYVWEKVRIEALKVPDDVPDWYDAFGTVQVTPYKTWGDLKQWANKLFDALKNPPSSSVKEYIASLKEKHPDVNEQVEAAIHFVQNEVRYTGIESGENSHRPLAPDKVFMQRYGDCKDKSQLLCLLMKEIGVTAYPALVNSYREKHISDLLPAPGIFNHCIVKIITDGKAYWIDPTINSQFGKLGSIYCPSYGKALVVNDESKDLTDIPDSPPGFTKVDELYLVKDSINSSSLIVNTEYLGSDADLFRSQIASTGREEMEENFLTFYDKSYPGVTKSKSLMIEDDSTENKIHTVEEYLIPHIWEITDSVTKKINAFFYAEVIRTRLFIPPGTIRTVPLAVAHPLNYTQTIKILLWDEWTVKNETYRLHNEWFSFSNATVNSGDTIVLSYAYKTFTDAVPADRAAEYAKAVKNVSDNTGYSLSYDPSAATTNGNVNILMILVAVFFTFAFIAAAYKVYKLSVYNSTQTVPYDLGGWLILVLIGMIATPLMIFYQLLTSSYFNQAAWAALTTRSSPNYSPLWAGTLVFELIGNLVVAYLAVFCIILMLKKRDIFPRVAIVYFAISLLCVSTDYLMAAQIEQLDSTSATSFREVTRSLIAAVIWIPYMFKSQRVKETFIIPYRKLSLPPEEPVTLPVQEEIFPEKQKPGDDISEKF